MVKPRLKKKKGGYANVEEDEELKQSKSLRKSKRTLKRSGKNAATQMDFKLRQAVEGGMILMTRMEDFFVHCSSYF